MQNNAIESLRSAVAQKKTDKFEVGDVVRWVASGKYSYAAIKTEVGWYTTANNPYVPHKVGSFDNLVEILNRSEVSDIAVASTWEFVWDE
jgi:hypothetical protein